MWVKSMNFGIREKIFKQICIDMEYMMDIVFINEISKKELIENILKEGLMLNEDNFSV